MTFHTSNPTFATTLAQTLITRGLGYTFYKSEGNAYGEFVFSLPDARDSTVNTIRQLAEEWGVHLYENHSRTPDM